jgi:hypothetical protein
MLRQLLESSVEEYATVITGRRDGGPVETIFGPEDPAAMTAAHAEAIRDVRARIEVRIGAPGSKCGWPAI